MDSGRGRRWRMPRLGLPRLGLRPTGQRGRHLTPTARRRRRYQQLIGVAATGLVVAATSVYAGTSAAVSFATTGNGPSTVQAGQLGLTDDDSGSALFTTGSTSLDAGQVLPARCLAVTYTGDWAGNSFDSGPLTGWDHDKFWSSHDADVSMGSGEITIAATANNTQVYTDFYTLLNHNVQTEMRQLLNDGNVALNVWNDTNNNVYVAVGATYPGHAIDVTLTDRGVVTTSPSTAYNATTMRYLRFSSRGQDLRLQYSADASSWTTLWQKNVSFDLSNLNLSVQAIPWHSTPESATFGPITITPHVGVRLHANPTGALAPSLNMTVERGTGGSNASCAGFTPQTTVYSGTLAAMPATYDAANPATEWNPSAATQTLTYRINATVADNQAVANKTAAATFTWSAHAGD